MATTAATAATPKKTSTLGLFIDDVPRREHLRLGGTFRGLHGRGSSEETSVSIARARHDRPQWSGCLHQHQPGTHWKRRGYNDGLTKICARRAAGDEVYGADPDLRARIRGPGLGYVLQVAANRRVLHRGGHGPPRRDRHDAARACLAARLRRGQARRASGGTRGPPITLLPQDGDQHEEVAENGRHCLLVASQRRHR